jgi:hypothetical protein
MDTADPTEVSVAVLSTSAKFDSGVEFASLPPASLSSCCNNIFFNCFTGDRGEERRFYTSLANLELLLLMVGRCEKLAMDCGELPLLCWFVKAAFS